MHASFSFNLLGVFLRGADGDNNNGNGNASSDGGGDGILKEQSNNKLDYTETFTVRGRKQ